MEGQQNRHPIELVKSTVPINDSLAYLIQQGIYNPNDFLYAPTEEDYLELKQTYEQVFNRKLKTAEKGVALEKLIYVLFSKCKHLSVSKVRLHPNEIDCYARNKLFGLCFSVRSEYDSFVIECKNEKEVPKAEYMNKAHSIMTTHGKKFGIIVSKERAPRTFIPLAHDIFLKDGIIIVSLDKDDLEEIIVQRKNLLECIARKMDEVRLDATKSLVELGLYNA